MGEWGSKVPLQLPFHVGDLHRGYVLRFVQHKTFRQFGIIHILLYLLSSIYGTIPFVRRRGGKVNTLISALLLSLVTRATDRLCLRYTFSHHITRHENLDFYVFGGWMKGIVWDPLVTSRDEKGAREGGGLERINYSPTMPRYLGCGTGVPSIFTLIASQKER